MLHRSKTKIQFSFVKNERLNLGEQRRKEKKQRQWMEAGLLA